MNGSSVLRNYPRNCTMPWNEANRDTESWCVSVTADSAREMISTEQNWWRSGRLLRNGRPFEDRKSTRLNSSHVAISYAVFCLKKKKKKNTHKSSSIPRILH